MKATKTLTILACILTLTLSASVCYAQKEMKIGFVDLSRLFDEHHKTAAFDAELEKEQKDFEAKRNAKIEKIQEAQGKLALLNEDKKAQLQDKIDKMKADLLEFDREQKTTLTKDRNEKIREILLEIEQVVSNYAQKNGYDIILNDRVLIYGNPAKDLTNEILSKINANSDTSSSDKKK